MVQSTDSSNLTRRKFLTIIAATPALAAGDSFSSQSFTSVLDRFIQISSDLTGFSVPELDPDRAQRLFGWLFTSNHVHSLVSALESPSLELDDALAETMITFWYAGVVAIDSNPFVDTYTDSLIWKATWFATPKTICSPIPNDWSSLPPELL